MEEEKVEARRELNRQFLWAAFLATLTICAFMALSLIVTMCWDAFAYDVHLPLLTYKGGVGLTGMALVVVGLLMAAYTVAVIDSGEG